MLAVTGSRVVVQAFTGTERVAQAIHRFLLDNLAVGAGDAVQAYFDRFITNAHATSAGLVGGLFLVWSALTLFQNVDRAINDTWGIKRGRSLTGQAITYWMGLTLGPLLLAGSVTLAATARSWFAGTDLRFLAAADHLPLRIILLGYVGIAHRQRQQLRGVQGVAVRQLLNLLLAAESVRNQQSGARTGSAAG